jgi:hypothetical protein
MKHQMIWSNLTSTGLEHFQLSSRNNEIIADGIVIGVDQDVAFRIRYEIICDIHWQVRKVTIASLGEAEQAICLVTDGSGNWIHEKGEEISAFQGCLEVDISVTPFTNTLPIRRLRLHQGQSSEIKVVYIDIPGIQLSVKPQRYTCLEIKENESKYKFESLDADFTAILTVDADKLVKDYPALFQCVWAE